MVGHGKCACLLVDSNLHTHIVERALEVAESGESFQFLGRVDGIGYQFAQKDFVIAVEKFLITGKMFSVVTPIVPFSTYFCSLFG